MKKKKKKKRKTYSLEEKSAQDQLILFSFREKNSFLN